MISLTTKTSLLAAMIGTTFILGGCASKGEQQAAGKTTTAAAPAQPDPKAAERERKEQEKAAEKARDAERKANTREVVGINGQKGEVIGSPAPGSRFTKVQIGMSMRQVVDTIGNPNDEGSYITGKAWIPYYYGNDRYRTEFAYKGAGRLIFAENSSWYRGRYGSGRLIKIIHDAKDSGYR